MATSTTVIVENPTTKLDRHGKKGVVIALSMIFIQLAILLISAGKFDWIHAWVYTALLVFICISTFLFLLKVNPELLNERGKFVKEDTKPFDKLFFMFNELIFVPGRCPMRFEVVGTVFGNVCISD